MYLCKHMPFTGGFGDQKRISDSLKLELQIVVICPIWMLGMWFGFLEKQQVPFLWPLIVRLYLIIDL